MPGQQKAREDLVRVEAEIVELETRLADARLRAEKLRNFLEMWPLYSAAGPEEPAVTAQHQATTQPTLAAVPEPRPSESRPFLAKDSPFYGMGLAEAARVALKARGEPLTAAEIVRELRNGGWMFTAKNPSVTLYWALRERGLKYGDVVSVPGNRWSLTAWRPDDERLKAARAGLAAAAARGAKLGPPVRFTDDVKAQVDEMLRNGKKVPAIAREVGFSAAAIYRWLNSRDQAKPDLASAAAFGLTKPH